MPARPLLALLAPDAIRRELYLLTLYRLLEAALLCLAMFGPVDALLGEPRHLLLGRMVAVAYLLAALVLFLSGRRGGIRGQALAGVLVDITAAMLAMHALPQSGAGIAMMLLFNIGAAAFLLPLRLGIGSAVVAAVALAVDYVANELHDVADAHSLAELSMFAASYLAMATLTNLIGRQMRATEALAEQRGSQVANLAEVNELIIRRMRTGVLLVDDAGAIVLANEAAMQLLGAAALDRAMLALAAPPLAAHLQRWREDGTQPATPLQLGPGMPDVLPRFARLLAGGQQALVFLDDTRLAAHHAESLTLATLGRFSASLAHEIRNPLAAISYATQLMQESRDIPQADLRLLDIIYQQTQRMNGIVENVLGLARRERAHPEQIDLGDVVRRFVADYAVQHPLDNDQLAADAPPQPLPVMADRGQLQQVLTVLVHNALLYGRLPEQPARVAVRAHVDARGAPLLDVVDHGPGIPEGAAARLFSPFYTTSAHGTGLGLYIARELCLANQAQLEHLALPGGGTCFRIRLVAADRHALAPA